MRRQEGGQRLQQADAAGPGAGRAGRRHSHEACGADEPAGPRDGAPSCQPARSFQDSVVLRRSVLVPWPGARILES